MTVRAASVARIILAASLMLNAACGHGPPASVAADDVGKTTLAEIFEMYSGYALQHKKPPAQLTDLKAFQIPYPRGYSELSSGNFVVRFGTPLEPAGKVLAYPKDAQRQGGAVLFNDGTVKSMSADELRAAIQ